MSFLLRRNVMLFVKMDGGRMFLLENPDREGYVCSR
jgi:hypothetical protein